MTTLQISIPDDLLAVLGSEDQARAHLTRTAVLGLVKRQVISQGRGAELLAVSLREFQDLMAESDVPVVDVSEEELREGHRNLKEALGDANEADR